jgi:hypothetical protein
MTRLRYVTTNGLAQRFEVSERAARRRLTRLEAAGLVIRASVGAVTVVYPTARARRLLELPRRKAPQTSVGDHGHTVAVAELLAWLELHDDAEVLTERDLRRRHTTDAPACACAFFPGGRREQRWPDLAVRQPDGRLEAHELELSPKWTRRLEAIVRGYAMSTWIARVVYYVESPALGARIARCAVRERAPVVVAAWTVDEDLADAIYGAVEVAVES